MSPVHPDTPPSDARTGYVVTAFNEDSAHLRRTLGALLSQSVSGPVVVVDDGSSVAVASALPNVTVLRHPRNLGISAARNTGIARLTQCAFVAVINCDLLPPSDWA